MKKDWREDYQSKLCSAADAAKRIKSGDSIFTGGVPGAVALNEYQRH